MTAPLRLGLVGCGRLAEAGYVPAIERVDDVELTVVADPDGARARAVAPEVPAFGSARELVACGEAEAILVASPPRNHEEAACEAAAMGIPALVEKPPAPDLAGARRMAALDPAPWFAFNRRYSLGAGVEGALKDGGKLTVELRYRRFSWAPIVVRDPALLDLAPHGIDIVLRSGLGKVRRVSAASTRPERVELDMELEMGSARVSCACDRWHRERVLATGPDGARVLSRRSPGQLRGLASRALGEPHPLVASLAHQLEDFAIAARGGAPERLATAAQGEAVMEVVATAAASLARGGGALAPEAGAPA